MRNLATSCPLLLAGALIAALPGVGLAVEFGSKPYSLTMEAFANATGAYNSGEDIPDPERTDGLLDGELRLLGLYETGSGISFGPRVVLAGTTGATGENRITPGERSFLITGDWGRVELGRRRGLPDVLTGYAPNNYQFVSAEFGPASGRSLDPDGQLQTAFLDSGLRGQLNALSGLGVTSALFFDESSKFIYISPKYKGYEGGFSYAPRVDDSNGHFDDLVQLGLTHDSYWKQNVLKVGGTYSNAAGRNGVDDLHSLSLGANLTLDDALVLAASATYNSDSGLPVGGSHSDAYGYALSVNYNTGPWTYGGYYQHATAEGETGAGGNDRLNAYELGLSYRINTRVRLYGAAYFYQFDNEGGGVSTDRFNGSVLLVGTRLTL